jgi:hypothetical protein
MRSKVIVGTNSIVLPSRNSQRGKVRRLSSSAIITLALLGGVGFAPKGLAESLPQQIGVEQLASASLTIHEGSEQLSPFVEEADAVDPTTFTMAEPPVPQQLAQADVSQPPAPSEKVRRQGSDILGTPSIQLQGVFKQEGDDSSARARVTATYPVTPHSMFGAVVDLTTGSAFSDTPGTGLQLTELYYTTSPANLPELRFVAGLMDLTSYFDRNSFAKDGASHFFNLVFQTNPALSATGISSRIGVLANWNLTDTVEAKATAFSASRDLGNFAIDSFAGELGVRFGTAIIRGTYVSSKDAGARTGFKEIFQFQRDSGFGLERGDRETAYGINGELYIPALKLGLFGRYGRYENTTLGRGGDTYSFGMTLLDFLMRNDRFGIGYGRQLSNEDLRRQADAKVPDVLEIYYDIRVAKHLRAGVSFQERDQFSDTVFGFRLKTEFDVSPRKGAAR